MKHLANIARSGSQDDGLQVRKLPYGPKGIESFLRDLLALANEYIEPPLRIRYQPVPVNGKNVGVFEIDDCRDRPHMLRIDYSENLRRGDAYMRLDDAASEFDQLVKIQMNTKAESPLSTHQ